MARKPAVGQLQMFQEAPQAPQAPPTGEKSIAGGGDQWGFVEGEHLGTWHFPGYVDLVAKMRRTESAVTALEQILSLPIRSVKWWVEPSEEGGEAEAEEFDRQVKAMSTTWDDILREACNAILAGLQGFEIVNDPETLELKKLQSFHLSTVQQIITDDDNSLVALKQWARRGNTRRSTGVTLEVDRLLLFVYRKEAGNWFGFPLARNLYRDWLMRDRVLRTAMINLQRAGAGLPEYTLAESRDASDKSQAVTAMKMLNTHEEAHIVKYAGDEFKMHHPELHAGDFVQLSQHFSRNMLSAGLAQHLALGDGTAGSFKLAENHAEIFLMQEEALANWIATTMETHWMEKWYTWHFPNAPRPRIRHENLRHLLNPNSVIEGLTAVVQGGILIPNQVDEEFVRGILDLPDIPEDQQRQQPPALPEPESANEIGVVRFQEPDLIVSGDIDANIGFFQADPNDFPLWRWRTGPKEECAFCESLSGRIFRTGEEQDAWMPAHIGCDCYKEYIGSGDVERLELEADSSPVNEELKEKHGHFINNPEKYAPLKVRAGVSGRPFTFRRLRNDAGEMESVLEWTRGLAGIDVQGFGELLPTLEEIDRRNIDLNEITAGILALDRLPAAIRPARVVFHSRSGIEAVRRAADTLSVSVPLMKDALRLHTLSSAPASDLPDGADIIARGRKLDENAEPFLMARAALKPSRATQPMVRWHRDGPNLTAAGSEDAREDAADFLAYVYLRSFQAPDGGAFFVVKDVGIPDDHEKIRFYEDVLKSTLK